MMATAKRDLSTTPDAAPHQPAPRFALGWASLVYAIAVLMLAYPALGGGFLVNPQVNIEVETYRSQVVYVNGQVRIPGAVPLKGAMTIMVPG